MTTNAKIWLGDTDNPMDGEVVIENEATSVAVERSDHDEVSIHATMPGDNNALVSLYFTRHEAANIAADILRAWQGVSR